MSFDFSPRVRASLSASGHNYRLVITESLSMSEPLAESDLDDLILMP